MSFDALPPGRFEQADNIARAAALQAENQS